jgi:hypothetical protein
MSDPLAELAARAEREPYFLASVLAAFARSEGLDDVGLAAALGCLPEDLVKVRLCRAPRTEWGEFWEDVTCIAERFGLNADRLAEAVKRVRVLNTFQEARAEDAGFLMAARDSETEASTDQPPEAP